MRKGEAIFLNHWALFLNKTLFLEGEYLHEKMISNLYQPLGIILEQKCFLEVTTNNSDLQETDYSPPETLTNLRFEKENLFVK